MGACGTKEDEQQSSKHNSEESRGTRRSDPDQQTQHSRGAPNVTAPEPAPVPAPVQAPASGTCVGSETSGSSLVECPYRCLHFRDSRCEHLVELPCTCSARPCACVRVVLAPPKYFVRQVMRGGRTRDQAEAQVDAMNRRCEADYKTWMEHRQSRARQMPAQRGTGDALSVVVTLGEDGPETAVTLWSGESSEVAKQRVGIAVDGIAAEELERMALVRVLDGQPAAVLESGTVGEAGLQEGDTLQAAVLTARGAYFRQLKQLFTLIDTDGDGCISAAEWMEHALLLLGGDEQNGQPVDLKAQYKDCQTRFGSGVQGIDQNCFYRFMESTVTTVEGEDQAAEFKEAAHEVLAATIKVKIASEAGFRALIPQTQ